MQWKKKTTQQQINECNQRLYEATRWSKAELFAQLTTSDKGITQELYHARVKTFGVNLVRTNAKQAGWRRVKDAIVNPFNLVLLLLAFISFMTDLLFRPAQEREPRTVVVILLMVCLSTIIKYVQENNSSKAAEKLKAMISTTTRVCRRSVGTKEIDLSEVVPR